MNRIAILLYLATACATARPAVSPAVSSNPAREVRRMALGRLPRLQLREMTLGVAYSADQLLHGTQPGAAGDVACATSSTAAAWSSPTTCWSGGLTISSTLQAGALQIAISQLAPVVTQSPGGTANQHTLKSNTIALVAGAATVNYGTAFTTTAPVCTCTDQTAANAVKCSSTTSTLTIAGTGTDTIAWVCFGRK